MSLIEHTFAKGGKLGLILCPVPCANSLIRQGVQIRHVKDPDLQHKLQPGYQLLKVGSNDVTAQGYDHVLKLIREAERPLTISFSTQAAGGCKEQQGALNLGAPNGRLALQQLEPPHSGTQSTALRQLQQSHRGQLWAAKHADEAKATDHLGAFAEKAYHKLIAAQQGGPVHLFTAHVLPSWIWYSIAQLQQKTDSGSGYNHLRSRLTNWVHQLTEMLAAPAHQAAAALREAGHTKLFHQADLAIRSFQLHQAPESLHEMSDAAGAMSSFMQLDCGGLLRAVGQLSKHSKLYAAARTLARPKPELPLTAALAAMSPQEREAKLAAMTCEEKAAALEAMSSEDRAAALQGVSAAERAALCACWRKHGSPPPDHWWGGRVLAEVACELVEKEQAAEDHLELLLQVPLPSSGAVCELISCGLQVWVQLSDCNCTGGSSFGSASELLDQMVQILREVAAQVRVACVHSVTDPPLSRRCRVG